jgi:hypothetical protein
MGIHESSEGIGKVHQWTKMTTDRDRRRMLTDTFLKKIGYLLRTGYSRTEEIVSTKTDRREFHKFNIHGRAAVTKHLITESNAEMRNLSQL